MFDDEELAEDRRTRDPVAPARPSASARRKKLRRRTPDGLAVHSFDTLLKEGFKSNSKDFNNTARNMLMSMRKNGEVDIMKVSRGYMYKYKEEGSVPHMDETEPNSDNGGLGERSKPTDL